MPCPIPEYCDAVYATVYSSAKTGREGSATGIIYWSFREHSAAPLIVLDWDIVQIEGRFLPAWLPFQFDRLAVWGERSNAMSSIGMWIEDKAAGSVILNWAERVGLPAQAVPEKVAKVGKDELAINASGYTQSGLIKFTDDAHALEVDYRGVKKNHLLMQIAGFKPGAEMADELLRSFTYGVALSLGDASGA